MQYLEKILTGLKLLLLYSSLGEKAFGTNPGYAEMMFTIRATHTKDFEES